MSLFDAMFLATLEAIQKGVIPPSTTLNQELNSFVEWCHSDPDAALEAVLGDNGPDKHQTMLTVARQRPLTFERLIAGAAKDTHDTD